MITNHILFTRLLLCSLAFTNRCISKDSCLSCILCTKLDKFYPFNAICRGESDFISTLKLNLKTELCCKCCEKCIYQNDLSFDNPKEDLCEISKVFIKMCGNRPKTDRDTV